ncbi:MAG TPA: hypothetical protein VFO65_04540 [Acidimicrobiales bacterium]|nr:hypothetical protein [Acidimicrobiales bacterium]
MAGVAMVVVAGLVHAGWGPAAGAAAHGVVMLALLNRALPARLAEEGGQEVPGADRGAEALAALALLPVAGLLGVLLSLPGAPLLPVLGLAGVALSASAGRVSRSFLALRVLRPRGPLLARDGLIALGGPVAGLGAFVAVGAGPVVPPGAGPAELAGAVAVLALAGVITEVVLRGLVQPARGQVLAGSGVVPTTLAAAAVSAGAGSARVTAVVEVTSLLLGWAAAHRGACVATAVAHAAMAVTALLVWPLVLG